ncbi:MAG: hypothetical protein ACK449_05145 [Planctomycetota bacterium]
MTTIMRWVSYALWFVGGFLADRFDYSKKKPQGQAALRFCLSGSRKLPKSAATPRSPVDGITGKIRASEVVCIGFFHGPKYPRQPPVFQVRQSNYIPDIWQIHTELPTIQSLGTSVLAWVLLPCWNV